MRRRIHSLSLLAAAAFASASGCASATQPLAFVTVRTDSATYDYQAQEIRYAVTIVNRGKDSVLVNAACNRNIAVGLRWRTEIGDSFGQTDPQGFVCNGLGVHGAYVLAGGQSVSAAGQHPLVRGDVFTPVVLVGQGGSFRSIESDSFDSLGRIETKQ